MKPDRDLRAAAIGLMATVAAVGVIRGLVPRAADATPAASTVLVRPQTSSGDPAEPAGTLHLNSRGHAPGAAPGGWPAWPGIQPGAERPTSVAASRPGA